MLRRCRLTLTLLGAFLAQQASANLPAEAVLIDVRTPAEYAEGHVEGAHLIPFDGIATGIAALELDKDAPVYLYCGSGRRAEKAKQDLENRGFSQVTNLGGLEQAQQATGEQ